MQLPAVVQGMIDSYLSEVDVAAPGLVVGLYLTGSLALDDFQAEASDIDVVAVCTHHPRPHELRALADVHRPSRPHLDVLYVTWDDLRSPPSEVSAAHSLQGAFHPDAGFAANPVEWRTLQTRAVTLRGPDITQAEIWFDPQCLRRWNADNLTDYWQGRLDWMGRLEPTEEVMRWEYGLQWLVLGVPRLHYTIATLAITSKTGAGRYALGLVDERWHPVIETCIALRVNRAAPLPVPPDQLRRDAVELATWLVADAHRLVAN